MAELQFLDKDGVDIVAEHTKAVDDRVNFASVNTLKIIFDSSYIGGTYSVTDGDELYEGTIQQEEIELALLKHETTYTITVSCDGEEYENSVTTGIYYNHYEVEFEPNMSLEKLSWAEISEIAQSGEASSYWSIGDSKSVTLNGTVGICEFNNETYYAYILGFDHNSDIEGKNTIHWQFGYNEDGVNIAFTDSNYNSTGSTAGFRMNTSNTNVGGWESSYMRNTICPEFLAVLPDDLQSIIKETTKYTDNVGYISGSSVASSITATQDKIFLLNCCEVNTSEIRQENTYERDYTKTYDYYVAGNSRIKYRHTSTSSTCDWWVRSLNRLSSYYFCCVTTGSDFSYDGAFYSFGFAPAFVV